MNPIKPCKKLAAVCGLFCPSCTIYIGSSEDPGRLKKMAALLNQPVEETRCNSVFGQQLLDPIP